MNRGMNGIHLAIFALINGITLLVVFISILITRNPAFIMVSIIGMAISGWLYGRAGVLIGLVIQYLFTTIVLRAILPEEFSQSNIAKGLITFSVSSIIGLLSSEFGRMSRKIKRLNLELAERNQELKDLTFLDPLTRLNNRRYVHEVVYVTASTFLNLRKTPEVQHRNMNTSNKVMGIFMIDIDDFKKINDEHGHEFGDRTLVEVASCIKNKVRSDDIVIRWGGEEFLVILPHLLPESMEQLSAKLLHATADMGLLTPDGNRKPVTLSIGATYFPLGFPKPGPLSFEDVINLSDALMYMSKGNGKNQSTILHASETNHRFLELKNILTDRRWLQDEAITLHAIKGPPLPPESNVRKAHISNNDIYSARPFMTQDPGIQ